jgi:tRNA A37 threonylcarbamoyltransferase TsaD
MCLCGKWNGLSLTRGIGRVTLASGVAANNALRKRMEEIAADLRPAIVNLETMEAGISYLV